MFRVCVSQGADVNNKRSDGITALMAAAVGGHAKVSTDHLDPVGGSIIRRIRINLVTIGGA